MSGALLLDTHAAIWLSTGAQVREAARKAVRDAVGSGAGVHVSTISAWEVALLLQRGRVRIAGSAITWFRRLTGLPAFRAVELSADILVASVALPNGPPSDPADRILIATARACSLVLLTRDRSILRYGDDGHVRTIAC